MAENITYQSVTEALQKSRINISVSNPYDHSIQEIEIKKPERLSLDDILALSLLRVYCKQNNIKIVEEESD